jgi:hypothetical protein
VWKHLLPEDPESQCISQTRFQLPLWQTECDITAKPHSKTLYQWPWSSMQLHWSKKENLLTPETFLLLRKSDKHLERHQTLNKYSSKTHFSLDALERPGLPSLTLNLPGSLTEISFCCSIGGYLEMRRWFFWVFCIWSLPFHRMRELTCHIFCSAFNCLLCQIPTKFSNAEEIRNSAGLLHYVFLALLFTVSQGARNWFSFLHSEIQHHEWVK